jgi:hypothetical protein
MVKFQHNFGEKMGWAAFWAIFSQTHLVTLIKSYIGKSGMQPGI